jgi:hypothetical protein
MKYLDNPFDFPVLSGVYDDLDWNEYTMVPFNWILSKKEFGKRSITHFFIYDYQFERVWKRPDLYVKPLKKTAFVLSPDFSLYSNLPLAQQIWNTYRNRAVGKYWESQGLWVIPSVSWSDERSFSFCFAGIPKNSVIAISSVGVKDFDMFERGLAEMINRLSPKTILCYGTDYLVNFPKTYYFFSYIQFIRQISKQKKQQEV